METDLRVRVVSKSYKNGKYYKAKVSNSSHANYHGYLLRYIHTQHMHYTLCCLQVIIEDVEGIDLCSCKTDDGDFLDNLRQDMLETTIPKAKMAVVKIVAGKYKGEVSQFVFNMRFGLQI